MLDFLVGARKPNLNIICNKFVIQTTKSTQNSEWGGQIDSNLRPFWKAETCFLIVKIYTFTKKIVGIGFCWLDVAPLEGCVILTVFVSLNWKTLWKSDTIGRLRSFKFQTGFCWIVSKIRIEIWSVRCWID